MKENQELSEAVFDDTLLAAFKKEPWNTTSWAVLPLMSDPVDSLCVVTDEPIFRCGATCEWTVPAGVTEVQFQLWGPGATAGRGCCCGGGPFGATGAYATTIISVTPGDVYTVCAGCATDCYPCNGGATHRAGDSFVTGPGLNNLCAMGGCASLARYICIGRACAGTTMCCRMMAHTSTAASGGCICNSGFDYCFDNSCASCGLIEYVADCEVTFHGTQFGLSSMWGETCYDTNHYGWNEHPPLIAPDHTVQPDSQCCSTWTSSACCGYNCRAETGVMCYPGAGGFRSHMMGGSDGATGACGDAGRAGMVKISWK